ncbi:MAG: lipoprotein signal peptidase [Bacteroidales bacterium]|nr:lipoprotein signal peptidase [Bacteroidales bacterium]
MRETMTRNAKIAIGVIVAVLAIDQIIKIWIKTHMMLGESIEITSWFYIHFVENNGMAFGMEMGGGIGKLLLSLFRIVAVGGIGYYLVRLCKGVVPVTTFLVVLISMILAGAVGNILDSVFYGVFFDSSYGQIASFLPSDGGYSTWLHGRVVDMFYFPLIEGRFPEWVPFWGDETFIFFRPVFNFADASISVGIIALLLFRSNELSEIWNKLSEK